MAHPIDNFVDNAREVLGLLEIHESKTGKKRGRRFGMEIVNKSGIVMITACWEAFVEDTAVEAFEFLLAQTSDHSTLPSGILRRVAKHLKEDKNEIRIWNLANDGWKQVLRDYRKELLHSHVSFFNTPRAGNVDDLFKALLDYDALSNEWHWNRISADSAKKKLADYITLRGAIAHRVKASESVLKDDVVDYSVFIMRLAVRTSNVIRDHVHKLVGKYPWTRKKMGKFA